MDILASLLFSATLRKAAALEQWLCNHQDHHPKPVTEFSREGTFVKAACGCGGSIELTVIIDIVSKVTNKGQWLVA